jgi:hypothetical protein
VTIRFYHCVPHLLHQPFHLLKSTTHLDAGVLGSLLELTAIEERGVEPINSVLAHLSSFLESFTQSCQPQYLDVSASYRTLVEVTRAKQRVVVVSEPQATAAEAEESEPVTPTTPASPPPALLSVMSPLDAPATPASGVS